MIKIKFEPPIIQAIPLSPDDLIEIQVLSSIAPITLDLEGTCYNEQGDIISFKQDIIVPSVLVIATIRIRLGYKFLLSAVLHTRTSSVPDGSIYCRMSLCKSESGGVFPYRKILSQGYVSTYGSIGYGSPKNQGPPRDHFFMECIDIPDPAAGANGTYTSPDFTSLEILCVSLLFTSSATVINRAVQIRYTRPTAPPFTFNAQTVITASQSYNFHFFEAAFVHATPPVFTLLSSIPKIIMMPGSVISTLIDSIQAADQVSDFRLLCKRQTIPF